GSGRDGPGLGGGALRRRKLAAAHRGPAAPSRADCGGGDSLRRRAGGRGAGRVPRLSPARVPPLRRAGRVPVVGAVPAGTTCAVLLPLRAAGPVARADGLRLAALGGGDAVGGSPARGRPVGAASAPGSEARDRDP